MDLFVRVVLFVVGIFAHLGGRCGVNTWGVWGWGGRNNMDCGKVEGGMQARVSDGVERGESGGARAPPPNHASARWANIFVNM